MIPLNATESNKMKSYSQFSIMCRAQQNSFKKFVTLNVEAMGMRSVGMSGMATDKLKQI